MARKPELTPKQEHFCQKYIELSNASEAYRQSYDAGDMKQKTIIRSAFEVMENPRIIARIAELRAVHQKRHEVTVDSLTDELEEARRLALDIQQPAPAVSASMGKAKIHGLIVEKGEITGKDGKDLVPETDPIDLARRIAFLLAQGLANSAKAE